MKSLTGSFSVFYILISFSIFFTGCSTSYRISDYTSRKKFYNNFNSFAKDKRLTITTLNDSTFVIPNGAAIVNDTLCSLNHIKNLGRKKIAINNIKEINYLSYDYKSAIVRLKDGEVFNASKINFIKDTIYFENSVKVKRDLIPASSVKKAVYKNHVLGMPVYAGFGILTGFIGGFLSNINDGNGSSLNPVFSPVLYGIFGSVYGLLLGTVAGAFIGYDYIYYFNN